MFSFRAAGDEGGVSTELMSTIESMNARLVSVEKLGAGLTMEGKVQYELVDDANQRTATTEERLLAALEACNNRIGLLENKAASHPPSQKSKHDGAAAYDHNIRKCLL